MRLNLRTSREHNGANGVGCRRSGALEPPFSVNTTNQNVLEEVLKNLAVVKILVGINHRFLNLFEYYIRLPRQDAVSLKIWSLHLKCFHIRYIYIYIFMGS